MMSTHEPVVRRTIGDHLTRAALTLTFLVGLCATGCQNFNKPPDKYLASIIVPSDDVAAIQLATVEVFRKHFFQGGMQAPGQFTFQRAGSHTDDLLYGSFWSENVTLRAQVTVTDLGNGSTMVGCNASFVRNAGDPIMEDAQTMSRLHKEGYQKMLNEIPAQMKQEPQP